MRLRPLQDDVAIRYTLDGTEPTRRSALYTGSLTLQAGITTVRARAYAEGSEAQSPSNARRFTVREPVDP